MNNLIKKAVLPAAILVALTSQSAFATNGLTAIGVGVEHEAMGGASVGNPVNTMSMATNPASASFISDGWDAGVVLFKPDRTAKISGSPGGFLDGTFDGNEDSSFLIPSGGYKKTQGDYSVGVVVYGAGGMNTNYATNPYAPIGSSGAAGQDLSQLVIAPTISKKIGENQSIGISANITYQRFKAEGIQAFAGFSSDSTNLTNNGYDSSLGLGATIGWQAKASDDVTVGVSYKTESKMGKLDKYKGLFPNQGELNTPAIFNVGLGWKATPKTTVAIDASQINHENVAALSNNKPLTPGSLGTTDGPGFGWKNQTVLKLGVKHQVNPQFAVMAGYNHGDQPIREDRTVLNILAPAVVEDHFTLGGEWKVSKNSAVTATYVRTFKNELEGSSSLAGLGLTGEGDIEMEQDAIGIGYSRKF